MITYYNTQIVPDLVRRSILKLTSVLVWHVHIIFKNWWVLLYFLVQ